MSALVFCACIQYTVLLVRALPPGHCHHLGHLCPGLVTPCGARAKLLTGKGVTRPETGGEGTIEEPKCLLPCFHNILSSQSCLSDLEGAHPRSPQLTLTLLNWRLRPCSCWTSLSGPWVWSCPSQQSQPCSADVLWGTRTVRIN